MKQTEVQSTEQHALQQAIDTIAPGSIAWE